MELGDRFAAVTPAFTPLFLDLPDATDATLHGGGFFGAVLRLYRDRNEVPSGFRRRLSEVIGELETMPRGQRLRWLELLSYIHAMVYHVRDEPEHPDLNRLVESSVETDERRSEYMATRRTIAQALQEEGALAHGKDTLLRQLRIRFGDLPAEVTNRVENVNKLKVLNNWLERFASANTLDEVGIVPRKPSHS
jgi:hypothetical protein